MSAAPRASLLVVSYRSEGDLPGLISSFREEVAAQGLVPEIVVVDHSERADVPPVEGVDRWLVQPNRGYAAGVNRAAEAATGEILLPANPDVRFREGSLRALVAALDAGWEVVGPRFELAGFAFPPGEEQTPRAEIGRVVASLSAGGYLAWLARRLEEADEIWSGAGPVRCRFLSGALLAFRRETWQRLGPWPEEYFLYFEESEWLLRAARRGVRIAQVPTARVEHRWGGSTGPTPEARYESARDRYYRRNFGAVGRAVLALPRRDPTLTPDPASVQEDEPRWWLASPSSTGWPAARWLDRADESPEDAARRLAGSLAATHRVTLWSWRPRSRRIERVRAIAAPGA